MIQHYYIFKLQNITDHCEVRDPYTDIYVSNLSTHIKVNKPYKKYSDARDPTSKFYNKYIPYYNHAPILEVENGKLIMLEYLLPENFMSETTLICDEHGFVELEEMSDVESKLEWLNVITLDIEEDRNNKLNQILEIEDVKRELTIEDIFNGDFSIEL